MLTREEVMDLLVGAHEHEWVISITGDLEEELVDDVDEVPVSIFTIPKTLISSNQDAYIPHQVAIGPYHHRRPDLYEMERYKVSSGKRIQKKLKNVKLQDVAKRFLQLEDSIRACYHRYLDFDGESLAWLFAIDASFLLEYLHTCAMKDAVVLSRVSSKMSHLVDYTGRKFAHQAIRRDIIMLENQIPLFLLRELLGFFQCGSPNEVLAKMVEGLFKALSPLNAIDNFPSIQEKFEERAHLLELLYYILVCRSKEAALAVDIEDQEQKSEDTRGVFHLVSNIISFLCSALCLIKRILTSKQVMLLLQLPWKIFKFFHRVTLSSKVENIVRSAEEIASEIDCEYHQETPLIEEITVGTVSELSKVGIRFSPSDGGLSTIKFDKRSGIFYLPIINLDENSEVVLRNLVAFEASIAPEVMVLTRYVDLMNEIIETKEDVKILRESGVIFNRLKSDVEVSSLWNGMSKSIKTTKMPILDKSIEGINAYYSSTWRVRAGKAMNKYVFGSWPFLTFLAANLVLLFTAVEAFCSVYKCRRWFSSS